MATEPAVRVQQVGFANLEANRRAMQSLLAGLQSIQDAKKERAEGSVLSQLFQVESPEAARGILSRLAQERQGQGFFDKINPFGSFSGVTDVERKVGGSLLADTLRPRSEINRDRLQAESTRARTAATRQKTQFAAEDRPRQALTFEQKQQDRIARIAADKERQRLFVEKHGKNNRILDLRIKKMESELDPSTNFVETKEYKTGIKTIKELQAQRNALIDRTRSTKDSIVYQVGAERTVRKIASEIKKINKGIRTNLGLDQELKESPLAGRVRVENPWLDFSGDLIQIKTGGKWETAPDETLPLLLESHIPSVKDPQEQQELQAILERYNETGDVNGIREALNLILEGI